MILKIEQHFLSILRKMKTKLLFKREKKESENWAKTFRKVWRRYMQNFEKKNNFMAPFYGWSSTASRLQPLRGGSLLFTTQFPEIPGKDERLSRPWSHPVVLNTGLLDWESSALTTRPLLHWWSIGDFLMTLIKFRLDFLG